MTGKTYIWRTVGDNRTRSEHAGREGKSFFWTNPPKDGHPGEPFGCRCWAELVAQNKSNCEEDEIARVNADAKLFIAKQNLERAEEELKSLEKKFKDIESQIEKEKRDKENARRTGAAIGSIIGTGLGTTKGLGGSMKGAGIGIGIGSNFGKILEEIGDSITDEKTDFFLKQSKVKIKKEIATIAEKIKKELKPVLEKNKKQATEIRKELQKCKSKR